MNGVINIFGVIGEDVNLADVISQVKQFPDAESWQVNISSPGGDVFVGWDIYDYISKLENVTTVGIDVVASMGSVIFLAGTKREVRENTIFMIHAPMEVNQNMRNKDQLKKAYEDLSELESKFVAFYKSKTNLTTEEITALLKNDTYLSIDQLLNFGFITAEPFKAVAVLNFNKNHNEMNENQKKESIWNMLKLAFAGSEVKAELTLNTAGQDNLVFADIDAVADIEVGVRASVNGESAEGTYLVEIEGTEKSLVFENGILTEIKDVEVEVTEDVEVIQRVENLYLALLELKEENDKMKAELKEAQSSISKLSGISSKFDAKMKAIKPNVSAKEDETPDDIFGGKLNKYMNA